MELLNLPEYSFKIKTKNGTKYIFDEVRHKYLVLSPEEWVRQNFIQYLINYKGVPSSLIAIEYFFKVNELKKRSDIVVFNQLKNPALVVECKAPNVRIDQKVFDQIAQYNIKLKVNFLVLTNGNKHFACQINHENKTYTFLNEIPDYSVYKL